MAAATGDMAEDERKAARDAARVSPVWQLLILVIGVLVLAHNVSQGWDGWNLGRGHGDFGVEIAGCDQDGFCGVDGVMPGGAMAAAGVRKGDDIHFDRSFDWQRNLRAGETDGFTLRRGVALSHRRVTAARYAASPQDRAKAVAGLFTHGVRVLTCLIGMFVTLRSRRRLSTLLFGAALICLGFGSPAPTLAESDPRLFPVYVSFAVAVVRAAPVLFLAFALAAHRETRSDVPWAWGIVLIAYAAVMVFFAGYFVWFLLTARQLLRWREAFEAQIVMTNLGYLLAFLALGLAWRASRGQNRTRYAYMLLAGALLALSLQVTIFFINLTSDDWNGTLSNPLVLFLVFGSVTGSAVFAYAVLRHRVLDLGFAVNRTLVYGAVSAILLAAFGLIEWAVEHFVPIRGREQNAILDAAIAVAVFLAFHRVRDGVEHVIERLFFRRWQRAEAVLRRFVKEAAFATRAETLTQAYASALGDYTEGAEAAVYLLLEDGEYHRASGHLGGMAEALDPDDPTLMAIRAEPKARVSHQAAWSLKAALAAPMVNRNEVIGLALLGPKPSGLEYRPDEVELIGWATRQVGLDLHALKVERLEADKADLRKTVAVLERALALRPETA